MTDHIARTQNETTYTKLNDGLFIAHLYNVGYGLANENKQMLSPYFAHQTECLKYAATILTHINKAKAVYNKEIDNLPVRVDQMTANEYKIFTILSDILSRFNYVKEQLDKIES